MDFKLSKAHELQRELFRKFAETEIKPIAKDMDEAEQYDMELLEKLKKYGMFGIPFSRELGGEGGDMLSYVLCVEEMSKVDASTGITISVHTSLCCSSIAAGSDEQKEKFLRPLLDRRKVGCFGLTEPNAGSDAGGVQTRAKLEGDHYVLNGSKVFITNSGFADTFVIFAMTDKAKGTRGGMSAFIIERGTPGLTVSANIERMGIRASQNCEIALEDVIVPVSQRIGNEGDGFKIAMSALEGGRIGIGAQAVGIAQGALNEAIKYIKERKQFGKTIASFQNTQFKVAEMQTKIDAARLLVYRAAVAKDNKEAYGPLAAMCKMYASEVAVDATRLAVQLMGGYGFAREYPVERMYRDAKITEIYEGTTEVMKMIISGSMKIK